MFLKILLGSIAWLLTPCCGPDCNHFILQFFHCRHHCSDFRQYDSLFYSYTLTQGPIFKGDEGICPPTFGQGGDTLSFIPKRKISRKKPGNT